MKTIIIICLSFCLFLLITLLGDRLGGLILSRAGYFKAMPPGITELYHTNEFTVTAPISRQGLRDDEVKIPKPAGIFRILAIGDSFTYGWGVNLPDSWPKQLEKMASIPDKKIEIVNAGVPGMNPFEDIEVCRAYKDFLGADMVILGLYSTDDLYQMSAFRQESIPQNLFEDIWPDIFHIGRPVLDKRYINPVFSKTTDYSKSWARTARGMVLNNPGLISTLDPDIREDFLAGKINTTMVSFSQMDKDYLVRFLDDDNLKIALDATKVAFRRLKSRCLGNTPAYIVFLPSQELVNVKFFPYRQGLGYNVDDKLLQFDIDKQLAEITARHGMKYLSLLSTFRRDGCFDCFYKWDVHLTALGNKKVAEFLAKDILFPYK